LHVSLPYTLQDHTLRGRIREFTVEDSEHGGEAKEVDYLIGGYSKLTCSRTGGIRMKSAGSISDPARRLTMLPWWYSSILVYLGRSLHRLGVQLLMSAARRVRKNYPKPPAVSVP
jgi:hypothetical protein